jgi:nicotinate-nucleotide adenylyltransferase
LIKVPFYLSNYTCIGLYGGSFNPVHDGHIHVAKTALKTLGLHKIIWLVSPQNPLKDTKETQKYDIRFNLVKQKAKNHQFIVSDFEQKNNIFYTCKTLKMLQEKFKKVKFIWIMGQDNLRYMHKWKDWNYIFKNFDIAVIARPNSLKQNFASKATKKYLSNYQEPLKFKANLHKIHTKKHYWTIIHTRLNYLSSTAIRKKNL